MKEIEHRESQS